MRKMLLSAVAVFGFVCTCIIASYGNYIKELNRVTVMDSVPNQIRSTHVVSGLLQFAENYECKMPYGARVEEIYKEAGDNFSVGDRIAQFEMESVERLLYENLMEQELLEVEKIGAAGRLAQINKKCLEEEAQYLKKIIVEHGIITAETNGQIISAPFEPGDVITESILYGKPEEGFVFQWELSPEEYKEYSFAEVKIGSQIIEVDCSEVRKEYNPITKKYIFYAFIPHCEEELLIGAGAYGTVSLQYISEEYRAVLPRKSINWEEGASYVYILKQRETNYGLEYYIQKTGVTILEMDERYVAVMSPVVNVVIGSEKELKDMELVLVVGEEK